MSKEIQHTLEVLWAKHCGLERLVTERREADLKALELQAREYERRISEANHHLARADARSADFIGRGTYEAKWIAHEETERVLHSKFEEQIAAQNDKIAGNTKLIYVGVGLVMALEVALRFVR